MTTLGTRDNPAAAQQGQPSGDVSSAAVPSRATILDLSAFDLTARLVDRQGIERYNAHRGQMALLDAVVWHAPDYTQGIAIKHVRDTEFWVPGHFPAKPILPGVLMIEAGAQLSSFLYNARFTKPKLAAFTHIDHVSFRSQVSPGDDLFLLSREIKFNSRRFITEIQGVVAGRVVFQGQITGMVIDG
jgi:3-hydroxyacyl-[acyl-carrier-protein] dehydratase